MCVHCDQPIQAGAAYAIVGADFECVDCIQYADDSSEDELFNESKEADRGDV